ncbi:leucyl/phenylalanyl-tRNA--protein transferase [Rhodohalobacter sp. 8-1]|uniref:leucyl/phenylalanyl-tRNA--protein transferase n=1 Tax=Rhodohalobacter sp. 8-1 TaxID=3131972 RepID=UPI0030EC8A05
MNSSSKQKIIPPETLLDAYSKGIFPMSESRNDSSVNWYSARQRGIIPMNEFKVSSNVQRIIRQGRFSCRINTQFREVMKKCANRNTTWISDVIINSFDVLHMAGHAHSVEMYDSDDNLAGGLYGVSLGAAFFGESMFKNQKEADKVALWHCHRILEKNGFELWDTQFYTDHLAQFGCIEISAEEYEQRLEKALQKKALFKE